jgi:hypothetical protein
MYACTTIPFTISPSCLHFLLLRKPVILPPEDGLVPALIQPTDAARFTVSYFIVLFSIFPFFFYDASFSVVIYMQGALIFFTS